MRVDLAVDAIADQMLQNVRLKKRAPGVMIFVRDRDQLRQPMWMRSHPSEFACLERRITFFGARIFDVMRIKRARLPYWRRDLGHAYVTAELLRQVGQGGITFLQAIVASLFGGTLIDTDASALHFMHHRQ